jgi:hypothetical protein
VRADDSLASIAPLTRPLSGGRMRLRGWILLPLRCPSLCGRAYFRRRRRITSSLAANARASAPSSSLLQSRGIDVIRLDREEHRELVSMRWGLVPYFWKKSLKEVPATFNARAETIADRATGRGRRREIDWKSGGGRDLTQPRLLVVEDHADRRLFPLDHRDWQPHGDEKTSKRPSRNAQV